MMQKRIAVICPGIGYHKDNPLLYYSARFAQEAGYELLDVAFHDMPRKIIGNSDLIAQAAALAFQQTEEQLQSVRWDTYEEILLIGKSIGTIAAAKYAAEHAIQARQLWYTPLLETFSFAPSAYECIAFIGDADPWSDLTQIQQAAAAHNIPLYLYPQCNHSLECGDILRNLENLYNVMQISSRFIRHQIRNIADDV